MRCIECGSEQLKKANGKFVCRDCRSEFTEEEIRMLLGKKSKIKQKFTGRREN